MRLAEQDAVSEEVEAGASVQLAFQQLGFGVDAFGGAVVVVVGESVADGVAVLVSPRVKACKRGSSSAWAVVIQVVVAQLSDFL
ncbi:hypothetical protein GCM10023322_82540 [Rugosimonospora acidiphila]|uniref:Uncharacterized protein n=1 Tax=Rugosimonospora acidiphila TaxID=556531 RepID=A0ABP9SS92_9ACTN